MVNRYIGTRMSPFWLLFELRMMEVVVTTGTVRRAKLQSNQHHQQTHTKLFTGRMPFLSPVSRALKERPHGDIEELMTVGHSAT